MSEKGTTNLHEKFGLLSLVEGTYFDKKMNKNLILALNYVEVSGGDFYKNAVAMIMYRYQDGKNRTETVEAFVEYAEANLELIERKDKQQELEIEPPKTIDAQFEVKND